MSTTPPNASGIPSGLAETKKSAVDSLDSAFVGSPLKKQRASVSGADEDGLLKRMGSGLTSNIGEVLGSSKVSDGGANPSATSAFGGSLGQPQPTQQPKQEEDEEEL